MARFKELDQEKIQAILETRDEKGEKLYPDILTPLATRAQETFRNTRCPKCETYSMVPSLNVQKPFSSGSPLPNQILRCTLCATELDPHSGLILRAMITDVPS